MARRRHDGVVTLEELAGQLRSLGKGAGLAAIGITTAAPFPEVRAVLEQRAGQGLAAGMQFTYRNPARSTDPRRTMAGARSLVVAARRYERGAPETGLAASATPNGPTTAQGGAVPDETGGAVLARVGRHSWTDHYAELRAGLGVMAAALKEQGWRAVVLADDNALVDRAAAQRAGIGWYGKNANILIPGAGSWFVLGSVLTDAALPPDQPVSDGCGACQRCLSGCPTGALVAPGVLDARRCLSWLAQAPGVFPREHRVALGNRIYGCDDCQEVCPVNRLHTRRQPPEPAPPDAVAVVDALDLLAADDATLLQRHGQWYLAGRQVRWLRRTALLVLGNAGDHRPAVVAAIEAALGDPDPALRGPAVWAAARLGLTWLLPVTDDDAEVRAELAAAGTVPARIPPAGNAPTRNPPTRNPAAPDPPVRGAR